MDINKILENNVNDLNMALNLAEESSNDTLRKYVQERLQSIRNNQGIYQFISVNSVVDSYIVDLELFYNLSLDEVKIKLLDELRPKKLLLEEELSDEKESD